MKNASTPRRRGVRGIAAGLLFFCLSLPATPAFPASANDVAGSARAYEERAAAEKDSRSRYRVLEWTSLVLILAAGGAAIFWAIRRK